MAPSFPVGPEMSFAIMQILQDRPSLSHIQIAGIVGADPDHEFFRCDLAVARAWLSSGDFPSDRIAQLEHEQWLNVRLSISMMATDVVDSDVPTMMTALAILERLEAAHMSSEHLSLAIQMSLLLDAIHDEGNIDAPTEIILRRYLEDDPSILDGGESVRVDILKKVLSHLPPKRKDTASDREASHDPHSGSEGIESEHGGEFGWQKIRELEEDCEI